MTSVLSEAQLRELETLRAGELARKIACASVSDVVFFLGIEGDRFRFTEVNPAFLSATGMSADRVVGKYVEEVIPEPSLSLVLSKYREAVAGRRAVRWNEVTAYPAGTKHGAVTVTPVVEGDGPCAGLVGVVQDVTEAYERGEAIRGLEAFSYSVAHDLRAPLRSINGFSSILLERAPGSFDDDACSCMRRIHAASERMSELIEGLLSLSRVTSAAVARRPVDLTALSRRVFAERAAAEPGRKVTVAVADGLTARGDALMLEVLAENLLGNAWKFTSKQPNARIEVGRERRGGEAFFFVRDNGAGFDMRDVEKLFKPFQRLHSQSEFPGTGIGLATVQRIVSRHGGRVWAEGAPGRGATFYFTLGEGS